MFLINRATSVLGDYQEPNDKRNLGYQRLSVCLMAFVMCTNVSSSVAATFTVNATHDSEDVSPGDGVAEDAYGDTTIRAAFMEANALAGDDTINIPSGDYLLDYGMYHPSDDMAQYGDLDVRYDKITVVGAGSSGMGKTEISISAYSEGARCLEVHPTAELVMTGVRIVDFENLEGGAAGGIWLRSNSTATLTDCAIINCDASITDYYYGAGIAASPGSSLTMSSCLISQCGGDGVTEGGGLGAYQATVSISNSTIEYCDANEFGGGISNVEGSVDIDNSTVRGNVTMTFGAGLYNYAGPYQHACLECTNVLIEFNDTTWGSGGGLANIGTQEYQDGTATTSLTDCTITDNITGHTGQPGGGEGGGVMNANNIKSIVCVNGTTTITNNTSRSGSGHDVAGTLSYGCTCTP